MKPPSALHVLRVLAAGFLLSLSACRVGTSDGPPEVYSSEEGGCAGISDVHELFQNAYAENNLEFAMRLFYWDPADPPGLQNDTWKFLRKVFDADIKKIEMLPAEESAVEGAPNLIRAWLRVSTKKLGNYDFPINRMPMGFFLGLPSKK